MAHWRVYKFKANADLVADEIKSLGDEIKPDMIVQYAKDNPDSEIHKCMTWDDTKAAEKWRLHEARMIVRSLVITIETEERKEQPIRMFLRTDTTSGYKETIRIYQNEDELNGMLKMAKAELVAFEKKYRILSNTEELKEIFRFIHDMN